VAEYAQKSEVVMRRTLWILVLTFLVSPVARADELAPPEAPLSLSEATRRALERNTTLAVERETYSQSESAITSAKGAYDLLWNADALYRNIQLPVNSAFSGAPNGELAPHDESFDLSTSFNQLLPTGGAVSLFTNWGRATTNGVFTILSPSYRTGAGIALTQPLLRNLFMDPAREGILVASADRSASHARLERTISDTVTEVESVYWDLVSSRRNVASIQESVTLAEQQLSETKSRVEAGVLGETDIAQPTAERERRLGNLALAKQIAVRNENRLKRLILGDPSDPLWANRIVPSDDPEMPLLESPSLSASLDSAYAKRPEIAEAEALKERADVQVEARKSDKLPQLNLVGGYQRRGLAGSPNPDAENFNGGPILIPPPLLGGTGRSYGTISENQFPDGSVGLSFSFPIQNRTAKANFAIAQSRLEQANVNITANRQQVESEVRDALVALEATRQRIEAARAGLSAAETQLYAEQERFNVGLSTNFLVLTRQNELTVARVTLTEALTAYRQAATELARATGTLLEGRQISVAGTDTAQPSGKAS
jgi:outer membrane protein TolC